MESAKKDVCLGCDHRSDQDVPAEIRFAHRYNPPTFCLIGYKQNPKSPISITNCKTNGGEVCPRIRHAYLPGLAGTSALMRLRILAR